MKDLRILNAFLSLAFLTMGLLNPTAAFAQDEEETLVVTPVNTRGWGTADTRPGGAVEFILDATSPAPGGALQLTTDATTTAKALYMHATETPIAEVSDLNYYSKQNSGPVHADPSYQFAVCLGGVDSNLSNPCIGFTTFVFEPYQNGVVIPGQWQQWDVDAGQMWSSRSYSSGTCTIVAGGGGAPFYTLAGLKADCPSAVAVGFGVNIGSNNPSYDTEVDLVKFNNTTYDFEVYSTPANAEECKKGGWSTFNPPSGQFKNQGQCVASTVPAS